MANLEDLKKMIISFDAKKLKEMKIPKSEMQDFLRYKIMPIELLVGADWNYKDFDAEKAKALAGNIKRQGQVENLNVRPLDTGYYEVGNGNTRMSVFEENGRQFTIVCDHGNITAAEFKRRVVEQNETHNKPDVFKLSELFGELQTEFSLEDLAETMPFTEDQIENYIEAGEYDWADNAIDPDSIGSTDNRVVVTYEDDDSKIKEEIKKLVEKYPTAEIQ